MVVNAGYIKGDFQVTFYGWAAGLALALLVGDDYLPIHLVWFLLVRNPLLFLQLCIPDWPMYNRNPVTWLDEVGKRNKAKSVGTGSTKTNKPKKSKKESETKSS